MTADALRKAAILIASLDDELARRWLGRFPLHWREAIEAELLTLAPFALAEQTDLIAAFLEYDARPLGEPAPANDSSPDEPEPLPLGPESLSDELELSQSLVALLQEDADAPVVTSEPPRDLPEPVNPLTKAELHEALRALPPEQAAFVLLHAQAEQAIAILSAAPAASVCAMVRQVSAWADTPAEEWLVEGELDASWCQRLQAFPPPRAGWAIVREWFQAAPGHLARSLLRKMAPYDQGLADRLLNELPQSEEQLECLEEETLLWLLQTSDPRTAVCALSSLDSTLAHRLLQRLPTKAEERLRSALTHLEAIRPEDIRVACREFRRRAREAAPEPQSPSRDRYSGAA